jgi:hypothetical protein
MTWQSSGLAGFPFESILLMVGCERPIIFDAWF